jgi:hypothetical protein
MAQELISQPAVEAFGVAVLPRRGVFEAERLDLDTFQPTADCSAKTGIF